LENPIALLTKEQYHDGIAIKEALILGKSTISNKILIISDFLSAIKAIKAPTNPPL